MQKRQGLYVSCIEEIAYRRGFARIISLGYKIKNVLWRDLHPIPVGNAVLNHI